MLAKSAVGKFTLLTLSIIIALGLSEASFRFYQSLKREPVALNLSNFEKPYLFFLNPDHPEISAQSFRGRALYSPQKPEGVFRVAALGDSVTYGLFVKAEESYPALLEKKLSDSFGGAEVINAGVNGYTTFNEFYFYRDYVSAYRSDIVLIGICMNDIVHPVLHWMELSDPMWISNTPEEAIPDVEFHQQVVLPEVKRFEGFPYRYLLGSHLYSELTKKWELLEKRKIRYKEIEGKKWPVYVADEDPVSLESLTDASSKQWKWLSRWLMRIKAEVESNSAVPVFLFFPLQYQLEEGYPLHPEEVFLALCEKEGMHCLDLIPFLRQAGKDDVFFLGRHDFHPNDVWHLTEEGHAAVAGAIADYISLQFLKQKTDNLN